MVTAKTKPKPRVSKRQKKKVHVKMQSFVSRVKTNPETGKHKGCAEELGKEKKKKTTNQNKNITTERYAAPRPNSFQKY